MNESFPTPEGPEKEPGQEETLLFDLKTRLEKLGEIERELDPSLRVELGPDRLAIIETVAEGVVLREGLSFEGEEIKYEAALFGVGEISDETLALIEDIEAKKGISLDDPSLGEQALKRMLKALESL